MRILVTGGAGYVGSHTAKALAVAGFEPIVFDNLSNGHAWAVQWGPLYVGDILDKDRLRSVIRECRPAAAIHFAASAYVGESMSKPRAYFRNNFVGTLNLIDCLAELEIQNVVVSSSCAVYGVPKALPIKESDQKSPINPYGDSKLSVERLLNWCDLAYGLRYTTLRYFNAAGADLDSEIGECHNPETHLIPLLIGAALRKRSHVDILGSDFGTPDGTAIRDYVHVQDLADAHVLALRQLLSTNAASMDLNLGTGNGFSVTEIVQIVAEISGRPVPTVTRCRREGDPPILVADPSKADRVLGWKPWRSEMRTIVQSALQWHIASESPVLDPLSSQAERSCASLSLPITQWTAPRLHRFSNGRGVEILRKAKNANVKLSVVIPNYNTAAFIVDAIASVLRQTIDAIEVIVVDDGSTDRSIEKILAIDDQRITCVRQKNSGLASSRNTGIGCARGAFIGFLDSDDLWYPDKAAKQIERMEAENRIGLSFSWSEYLSEAGEYSGNFLVSRCAAPTAIDLARRNHVGNGSTAIVRAECFDMLGGFDEELRNCEDIDMWVRIAACPEFEVRLVPEVLTGYRIRRGSLSVTFDSLNSFITNGTRAIRKFRDYKIPNYSEHDERRGLAELYRISSRKAWLCGDTLHSRIFLHKAFRLCPSLFILDLRAIGMLCLHVTPRIFGEYSSAQAYRLLRQLMRAEYPRHVDQNAS